MFAVRGSAASLRSPTVVLLRAAIFLSAVAASAVAAACAADDSREAAGTAVCAFARCWVGAGLSALCANGAPRALTIATQKIAELMCFMAGLLMTGIAWAARVIADRPGTSLPDHHFASDRFACTL